MSKKTMKTFSTAEVIAAFDRAFAPDVCVKLAGKNGIIVGCMATTKTGADYLLHNAILDRPYDEVILEGLEITFEVTSDEDIE